MGIKNSPTRIGSGSGVTLSLCRSVTLSLCDSVCNKWSNISATFHPVGRNFFVSNWARMYFSKKISQPWARGPGQNMRDLSSFLSYLTRYRSKILKLWSKIKKWKWKYFFLNGRWPWADAPNWLCLFWSVTTFCITMTHTYFAFKIKYDQKIFDQLIFGQSAAMCKIKTARHMGP